ncbi:MAG TPA: AbrB/MazE/SpoVT family DNA-binding domain-containing protein [Pyrinomonadaceae bacterium]|nr:AbrB/MazE/SpoVT family DNA-binding domain-containing protein [Pyrinomonadaceae bacterium]
MKAQIIRIGNSQGVRIPKVLLEDGKLSGEVELELHEDGILIRSLQKPRANWDAAFRVTADGDDDQPLTGTPTAFEKKEWQW